ncbi:MAG TPA: hypothetical protein VFW40_02100 [Capsulimonadaceae bacterium]|nr:hypothetical protein [Capsulimonadaceae bacterium]
MQCYRHPKIETAVSCGKCDRPICTKCMIPGPAGMRCPECASLRKTALYQIHPGRLALAIVAGLVTGVIGAMILTAIGFFVFFIGPIYGTAVAEAVLRASGRKRGRMIEAIGIGSIMVGALVVFGPVLLMSLGLAHASAQAVGTGAAPPMSGFVWGYGLTMMLWPLVGFVLAISACFYRLRYL